MGGGRRVLQRFGIHAVLTCSLVLPVIPDSPMSRPWFVAVATVWEIPSLSFQGLINRTGDGGGDETSCRAGNGWPRQEPAAVQAGGCQGQAHHRMVTRKSPESRRRLRTPLHRRHVTDSSFLLRTGLDSHVVA
eukprot:gene1983-biopygen998